MLDLRRADLHTHTTASDGLLAPAALVKKAHERGLHALAITDHDCIDGLEEATAAGAEHGVEVVPGVELSVHVLGQEVHMLAYCFDPTHAGLRHYLEGYRERRRERAEGMVERLNDLGVALTMDAVLGVADGGILGRPHVARALLAGGHVTTYDEAFEKYIRDAQPAFVEKAEAPAAMLLDLVHEAGGVAALAHPGHWTRDRVVMELVRLGLDGIEVVHPAHDDALMRYYKKLASEFGLLQTGGSDFHGGRERDEEHFGRFSIPYPRLERLRARRQNA